MNGKGSDDSSSEWDYITPRFRVRRKPARPPLNFDIGDGLIPTREDLLRFIILAKRWVDAARRCLAEDIAFMAAGRPLEAPYSSFQALSAAYDDVWDALDKSELKCPYGWPSATIDRLRQLRSESGIWEYYTPRFAAGRGAESFDEVKAGEQIERLAQIIADLETVAAGQSDVPAGTAASPYTKLGPARRLAYSQWLWAKERIEQRGEVLTQEAAYREVEAEREPGDKPLPRCDTWCKYVREVKNALEQQTNTSRAGREGGRSIVRQRDLD